MSDPLRRFLPAWLRTSVPPPAPPVQSEVDATEATQAYFERRIADAGRLFIDAVKSEEIHGPLNPRLATALNNLAEFYRVQGEFSQAEPYYWRAITIDEQALGPDHVNLARDLNNLALLYRAQGRYADAEPLYRRSLSLKAKAFGPDHPNFTTSLANYTALLRKTRGDAEAAKLESAMLSATNGERRERPRMTLVAGRGGR